MNKDSDRSLGRGLGSIRLGSAMGSPSFLDGLISNTFQTFESCGKMANNLILSQKTVFDHDFNT